MTELRNCPDAATLRLFGVGDMDPFELERLAEHVEGCARCIEALTLEPSSDALVRALETPPPQVEGTLGPLTVSTGPNHAPAEPATWPQALVTDPLLTRLTREGPPLAPEVLLAPAENPDEIGRLGPYRVLRVLGMGGMGVVFLAEDPHLRRAVALKTMKPAHAASAQARERFLREARAAAAIVHDHVMPILHVGEERGVPYLVMPFLQGESLADRLRREPRLPLAAALAIAREIAEGLAAAHRRGLIHRDIKPPNVWLEDRRQELGITSPQCEQGSPLLAQRAGNAFSPFRVKLLDFGLARPAQAATGLTDTDIVLGTPAYMAPEQARGEQIDARADLFALGCVLYRMVTGKIPFQADNALAMLHAIGEEAPKSPTAIDHDVPAAVSNLVMSLLAKDPARRPASAEDVVARIAALEGGMSESARPPARRWPIVAAAVLLALLPLGWLFGPAVIRIATNRGDLVIETDQEVRVVLRQGREEAHVLETGANRTYTITAGEYEPEIVELPSGMRITGKHIVLSRGGTQILNVRQELARATTPGPAGAPPPAGWPIERLRRDKISAEALVAAGLLAEEAPGELVAVLGDSRLRHWNEVRGVCFHPEGKLLVSAGLDHAVCLWDATTGKLVRRFHGPKSRVESLALGDAGKLVAAGDEGGNVFLWETDTGKLRASYQHRGLVHGVSFSGDGEMLASASWDGTVKLWYVPESKEYATLETQHRHVHAAVFSPHGDSLATVGEDGTLKLWNVEERQLTWSIDAHREPAWFVAYSPDGKMLATSGADRSVRFFEAKAGAAQGSWDGHGMGVPAMAFDKDGRVLAAAGHDRTLRLWDLPMKRALVSITAHLSGNQTVAFRPGGDVIATGGQDFMVKLWDSQKLEEMVPRDGHQGWVNGLAFSPDGRLLASGAKDGTIHLWDLGTGQRLRALVGHRDEVNSLEFSRDGTMLVSGSRDLTAKLWETSSWKVRTLFGHRSDIRSVKLTRDGKTLATGSADATVKLWDTDSATELRTLAGHFSHVNTVAWSKDERTLVSGSPDRSVKIWEAATGLEMRNLEGHTSWIEAVACSSDGRLIASASDDRTIKVWDAHTFAELRTLKGHDAHVHFVTFSPDNKWLASAAFDGTVRLWNPADGTTKHVFRLGPGGGHINEAAFSPDGRHLATSNGNGTVYILRLASK